MPYRTPPYEMTDLQLDTIHKYYILTNVLTKYLDSTIFFSTLYKLHTPIFLIYILDET